ncbi:MAG: hypothetical protein V1722_01095 [Candidatus Micrarchaeota archaeon]
MTKTSQTEKPKRPEFSVPTKFVYAELDKRMPFDKKTVAEMVRRRIIISVAKHKGLREQFREAGYTPEQYAKLFAIPFKQLRWNPNTSHGRSLHTTNAGDRQFVFKGTGGTSAHRSFHMEHGEGLRERQFRGGLRASTAAISAKVLQKLEKFYQVKKKAGDSVVKWAEEEHGIKELPVIKHVAVFKPLQIFSNVPDKPRGPSRFKRGRNRITKELMKGIGLGEFYDQQRVQVYTASEPTRLAEHFDKALNTEVREELVNVSSRLPRKDTLEKRRKFVAGVLARGLLLLHVAHTNGIALSDYTGSSLTRLNVSAREFFDFDSTQTYKSGKKKKQIASYRYCPTWRERTRCFNMGR